jgi:hypothetical protein
MAELVIQLHPDSMQESCGLCGKCTFLAAGPQLFTADSQDVVCRDCGKKHAPSLVSLLDLAGTAQRVGRIGRHSVFPPLTALLDLARAAEEYLHTSPPRCRQAVV